MLGSDILLFKYFKKKSNDWSSNNENALSYLESKSSEEISSDFINDSYFKQVELYIDSIKGIISDNSTNEILERIIHIIPYENKELTHMLIDKLRKAITEAVDKEEKVDQKEVAAIALAASIALIVLLSTEEKSRRSKKIKMSKSQ
jgi:hypothetical protein